VRLGDEVAADSPLQIEIEAFCLEIFPFVKEDGDFFGFIDSQGITLQAMYHSDADSFWFEVPCPDLEGAFGAHLSSDSASDLVHSLSGDFPKRGYPDFEFRAWK